MNAIHSLDQLEREMRSARLRLQRARRRRRGATHLRDKLRAIRAVEEEKQLLTELRKAWWMVE